MDNTLFLQPQKLLLIDEYQPNGDGCALPKKIWERFINLQRTEVLLIEVSQGGEEKYIIPVMTHHSGAPDEIYLPDRILLSLDQAEYVKVKLLHEMPPLATEITLTPLQPDLVDGLDLSKIVSEYIADWHILKEGTILTIPCLDLGGLELDILVLKIEPSNCVLLRGEVSLIIDLPKPVQEQVQEQEQKHESKESKEDDTSFETNMLIPIQEKPTGFVAFSGQGQRLGGRTATS